LSENLILHSKYKEANYIKIVAFKGLLIFTFIFFSSNVFSDCSNKELKIMPIGDSVTQGGVKPDEFSYRLQLYKMLNNAGYKVDFLGKQHGFPGKNFKWPAGFDNDHEGFYGKNTLYVAQALKKDLANKDISSPDVALILLGNNDQNKINLVSSVVLPMKAIIKKMALKFSEMAG
jgi:lysophospholipase L1-like esterase